MSDSDKPTAFELMKSIEEQVVFGDTKAGQLVGANALLLTALGLLVDKMAVLSALPVSLFVIAGGFLLVVSLVIVLIAIAPAQSLFRVDVDDQRPNARRKAKFHLHEGWKAVLDQREPPSDDPIGGFVHFARIAQMRVDYFVERMRTPGAVDIEQEILYAVHSKSKWALHKFKWLDRSVKVTIVAVSVLLAGGVCAVARFIVKS